MRIHKPHPQPPALWWSPSVAETRGDNGYAPGVLREVTLDGDPWFYELGDAGLSLRELPADAVPLREAPAGGEPR